MRGRASPFATRTSTPGRRSSSGARAVVRLIAISIAISCVALVCWLNWGLNSSSVKPQLVHLHETIAATTDNVRRAARRVAMVAEGRPHTHHASVIQLVQPTVQLFCIDRSPQCSNVLSHGLCFNSTLLKCKKECQQCGLLGDLIRNATGINNVDILPRTAPCKDEDDRCHEYKEEGLCERGRGMLVSCKATCGFCQAPAADREREVVEQVQHDAVSHSSSDNLQTQVALVSSFLNSWKGSEGRCLDSADLCPYMANHLRLCDSKEASWWMSELCPYSCRQCGSASGSQGRVRRLKDVHEIVPPDVCEDFHEECPAWAKGNGCNTNTLFMSTHCALTCGRCHNKAGFGGLSSDLMSLKIGCDITGAQAVRWLRPSFLVLEGPGAGATSPPPPPHTLGSAPPGDCDDQNESCEGWAKLGECQRNTAYMELYCKTSCGICRGSTYGRGSSSHATSIISARRLSSVPTFHWLPDPPAQTLLNNGVLMPSIGFGTAGLGEETQAAVTEALAAGYRHIDSAQARDWYREDLTGKALNQTHIPREQVFLTTKIHPRHLGYENTLNVFVSSLEELSTTYVDLVLLHYPSCWGTLCSSPEPQPNPREGLPASSTGTWQESWKALQELYAANKTRALGVSNFGLAELQQLYEQAEVKPQVVQVHMDPLSQNRQIMQWCRQHGVQMVAYSTLGTQWGGVGPDRHNPVLNHPVLQGVAQQVGKSVAQVVLRWASQLGVVVIPRSRNPAHMRESLAVWDFELNEDQMKAILELDGTAAS